MTKYRIVGGNRLSGDLFVQGSKNAALPILVASILSGGKCELHNVPKIADVQETINILKAIGCQVEFDGSVLDIDATGELSHAVPDDCAQKMRSSILFAGALLARVGNAEIALPGGCEIGKRAIDLHVAGLKALGAEVREENGKLYCTTSGLKGAHIKLHTKSVGATENLLLAAVLAEGQTIIENAACEPEINDLVIFLNKMGAKITGAGVGTLIINGVKRLRPTHHTVIADRIVAGTYLIATAMTGGIVTLHNVNSRELGALTTILSEMGSVVHGGNNCITIAGPERLKAVAKIKTDIFPYFPTDLQPQITAALAIAKGTSEIMETIFENRFAHCLELNKMGANINISADKKVFVTHGRETLTGCEVTATDLRCGAALVLAGLVAEGETVVDGIEFVKRGYVDMAEDLRKLGGDVVS